MSDGERRRKEKGGKVKDRGDFGPGSRRRGRRMSIKVEVVEAGSRGRGWWCRPSDKEAGASAFASDGTCNPDVASCVVPWG